MAVHSWGNRIYNYLTSNMLFTDDKELWITETERENNVHVLLHADISEVGTYYYGFIDKSDIVNWPHSNTGRIDLSILYLSVDKNKAAYGSILIGVITRIDNINSDIEYISGHSFLNNDSASVVEALNLAPTQMKCGVSNGTLDNFKTNIIDENISTINNSGSNNLSFGNNGTTFIPEVGDIVLKIVATTSNDMSIICEAAYHGK